MEALGIALAAFIASLPTSYLWLKAEQRDWPVRWRMCLGIGSMVIAAAAAGGAACMSTSFSTNLYFAEANRRLFEAVEARYAANDPEAVKRGLLELSKNYRGFYNSRSGYAEHVDKAVETMNAATRPKGDRPRQVPPTKKTDAPKVEAPGSK